jgi:ABC-2 type transport system ATP-binding protein
VSEAVIEARGLTKRYRNVVAVDNASFDVPRSTMFGLLGPNGAGKTTIVKMLTGLARPSAGSIRVFGLDLASRPNAIKRRIGHIYAGTAFFPALTANENLKFFGRFYGLSRRELGKRIEEMLHFVGLSHERTKVVGAFSSGMRQRLGIAKALIHGPDLLLFDEATNGVDVEGTNDILELMFDLRVRGKTAVITSHRLDEIELLCDDIAILDEGRIVGEGSPEAIRTGLQGILHKYIVHHPYSIREQWENPAATVRYIGTANVVLSEKELLDQLSAQFSRDLVEQVEPTFEEACLWILRHPEADGVTRRTW